MAGRSSIVLDIGTLKYEYIYSRLGSSQSQFNIKGPSQNDVQEEKTLYGERNTIVVGQESINCVVVIGIRSRCPQNANAPGKVQTNIKLNRIISYQKRLERKIILLYT